MKYSLLGPLNVCEQTFPVTQYFDIPPQTAVNKQCRYVGVCLYTGKKTRSSRRNISLSANLSLTNTIWTVLGLNQESTKPLTRITALREKYL
jgi:hypothetical protein